MRRAAIAILACGFAATALLAGATLAQQLVVDGLELPGVRLDLVPNVSYAPAAALAVAIGADYALDPGAIGLTLGGRVARLALVDSAAEAATQATALDLDGDPRASPAAVLVDGEAYAPVKPLVEAFGGSVAYLADRDQIVAVLPRATARAVVDGDRIVVELSAAVPYSSFYNAPLDTVQIRFERTEVPLAVSLEAPGVRRADLLPGAGYADLRVALAPGSDHRVYALANRAGYRLIVEARPSGAQDPDAATVPRRAVVVLDPGHGGADPGLATEAGLEKVLTLAFAQRLAEALERRGIQVRLTRTGDDDVAIDQRASLGFGSDLFVSLHATDLPAGSYRSYYLDDASDLAGLDFAVRSNAETAAQRDLTDSVRRRILLELIPDLDAGRRYAAALERELLQAAGYASAGTRPAPLGVLAGAAGRGLLLELAPGDLTDPGFAEQLAGTLATILSTGGL